MFTHFRSTFICATLLSLAASSAFAQYVAPPTTVVPYDAPPQTLIPRAGSIGRAMTPPTYYRSAPQMVPTTVYRPSTAYHPVTGQPYTQWNAASTLDVETQRVATPLPGYGAPFTAYRPAAPVTAMPSYYVPSTQMNVQGAVDPYSGNVYAGPVAGGYAAQRPVYAPAASVAPAYAVGRPVMGVPVVNYRGAWPFARRPAPVVVGYAPAAGYVPPVVYPAQPVYRGAPVTAPYATSVPSYVAPAYSSPAYVAPAYSAPAYTAPASSDPYYSPRTTSPAYSDPAYSDPGYSPGYAPADSQPSLKSSSMAPATSSPSNVTATRPLVPAQEARSTTTKPEVNWPRFLPNTTRKPAPTTSTNSLFEDKNAATPRVTEQKPAAELDPEVRPLRDPHSAIPDLNNHRAPPLLEGRSAGLTAPIRRLTLTPSDNVTGHTANPAAR